MAGAFAVRALTEAVSIGELASGLLRNVRFNRAERPLVKNLSVLFDNIRCYARVIEPSGGRDARAHARPPAVESSLSQYIRYRDVKWNDTASPELVPMSDFNAVATSGRVTSPRPFRSSLYPRLAARPTPKSVVCTATRCRARKGLNRAVHLRELELRSEINYKIE